MVTITLDGDSFDYPENKLVVRSGGPRSGFVGMHDDEGVDYTDDDADDSDDYSDGVDDGEDDGHVGWKYIPTDQDLIDHLRRIIAGSRIKCDKIRQLDIYSDFPWKVLADSSPVFDQQYVILTPRTRTSSNANTYQRTVYGGRGVWKVTGGRNYITDRNGVVFGFSRLLSFRAGNPNSDYGERSRTWRMVEFDPMLENPSNLAICIVYEKITRKAARELDKAEDNLRKAVGAVSAATLRVQLAQNRKEREELLRSKASLAATKKRREVIVTKRERNLVRLEERIKQQYGMDVLRAVQDEVRAWAAAEEEAAYEDEAGSD